MKPSQLPFVAALVAAAAGAAIGTSAALAQNGASPSAHPGDGVPDPAGRIAFGRITRMDDMYGQVVALYAIDPASGEGDLEDGPESSLGPSSRRGSQEARLAG